VKEGLSQRESCEVLEVCRSSLFYKKRVNPEKEALAAAIRTLAMKYPRFGYRRIHEMLRRQGMVYELNLVHRLWKRERLMVKPAKKKRKRNRGPHLPYPPKARYSNHVWTYDFMQDQLLNGKKIRILNIVDEFTRRCLAIEIKRSMGAKDVLDCLMKTTGKYGIPAFIRSDNGSEFIEQGLRKWLAEQGTQTLYVHPGSPWENGKCESFNGKFRDEFLNRELFTGLAQAQIQAEWWRVYYNTERPHSALDYQTPEEFYSAWLQQSKAPMAANWGECSSLSPTSRPKRFLAGQSAPCYFRRSLLTSGLNF
jgi:putative transposase